jgi:RND family efflux transporter MFP subunit
MMRRSTFLLLLVLPVGCSGAAPEEVESETVVPVTTEPAQTGTITAVIHATGTVTPAPGADFTVVAPEAARIVQLPYAEGDRVMAGDVLVRFEIPSTVAEAGRQRAEVERAQAQLANARAAQARASELFERGIAARKQVEDADRDVADAQAALAAAQAALAAADVAAARSVVRAPFSGVVARRLHNPGDVVEPAAADPVLRVVDPRRLEITASIPIGDVGRVRAGAAARLTSDDEATGPGLKVVSTPAAVETGTASVPVRLSFPGRGGLPVGMPVQLAVDAERHAGVVLIPAVALVREGEVTAVFVAAGNKVERRAVTIGIADEAHVEVTSGLAAGEEVITHGQAGLPDGAAIAREAPAK